LRHRWHLPDVFFFCMYSAEQSLHFRDHLATWHSSEQIIPLREDCPHCTHAMLRPPSDLSSLFRFSFLHLFEHHC
jgi:hypothetical protein